MRTSNVRRQGARPVTLALIATAGLATFAAPALPAEEGDVVVGPWIGAIALDAHLSDYRWDTTARPVWGLTALGRFDRFAVGARGWRASTSQATGIPGDDREFRVSLTGIDALGEVRLARFVGARLLATGSVGLVRFAWSPRELVVDTGGGPVTVVAEPIGELTYGGGMAVRRAIAWGFEGGAAIEHSRFSLETSHRRGDEIVTERESFGSWTARLEIARPLFAI